MYWILKAVLTPIVRICVRVKVEGREHLPTKGAVIIAANHRSFLDSIFIPMIASGIGVAAFFCFMFSWVEMLLAKNLTSVAAKPIVAAMTKTASTSGYQLGLLAAAGALTLIPGAVVIYFVRNYIAKGFALGRV